ncbi:MAG: class I tRNA ligase family protein [Chloroflexota bacterium]
MNYDSRAWEQKWRPVWAAMKLYQTGAGPDKSKYYILDYFPYPSGDGLSVGHCRNYVPSDVAARFRRMRGYNVLHPMGWDAFGLPAENHAILRGIHPRESTRLNTDNYRRQLQLVECSYDWSREINSTDPDYYRWTQWFFLLLFKRGLAYQAIGRQWWCPNDQTILANEQVENGRCWRCGAEVVPKDLLQWYFKITDYAGRLLADLEGLDWPEPIKAMQRNWIGELHDWLISRQRYWGAPIPIIHCPEHGPMAVPEEQLPVLLPAISDFSPAGDGRSPLAKVEAWVNTTCPTCGRPASRETDTLDGFACSSWYFLRFASPHYAQGPFDPAAVAYWLPVDTYVGGAEHAVMHLLYARFWTKVMYDAGLISFSEPFASLRNQGVLHAADGRRMSKSKGNVITPDEVIAQHGTDALRAYILFMGPFDANVVWDETGIKGITRFLERYWQLASGQWSVAGGQWPVASENNLPPTTCHLPPSLGFRRRLHQTIRRVTEDYEAFKFNTAVAALMEYLNYLSDQAGEAVEPSLWREALQTFTILLAPIAPFVAEEVWQEVMGHQGHSIHQQNWPTYDPSLAAEEEVTVIVQVNGKVRDRITAPAAADETTLRQLALGSEKARPYLDGRAIQKVIVVPSKLVNIVVE